MTRIEKALTSEDCAQGCSLFLVDVDNFKQVNDGFGHPEGDRVLQEIAAFLSRNMRKDDVVARLGGDEFAVFAAGLVPGPALDRVLSQLSGGIYATTPRPADMPEGLHPSITIARWPAPARPSPSTTCTRWLTRRSMWPSAPAKARRRCGTSTNSTNPCSDKRPASVFLRRSRALAVL